MVMGSWTVQENRNGQLQMDYGKDEKIYIGYWKTLV